MGRRLVPVALLSLVLTLAPSAASSLTPPIFGAQRILVVLVTWGPQPFTRDEVQHVVFDEADAFYRESSYGKAWLTATVTPWLKAFEGSPGCSVPFIRTAGAAAARSAGYDSAAYEADHLHSSVGRLSVVRRDSGEHDLPRRDVVAEASRARAGPRVRPAARKQHVVPSGRLSRA